MFPLTRVTHLGFPALNSPQKVESLQGPRLGALLPGPRRPGSLGEEGQPATNQLPGKKTRGFTWINQPEPSRHKKMGGLIHPMPVPDPYRLIDQQNLAKALRATMIIGGMVLTFGKGYLRWHVHLPLKPAAQPQQGILQTHPMRIGQPGIAAQNKAARFGCKAERPTHKTIFPSQ